MSGQWACSKNSAGTGTGTGTYFRTRNKRRRRAFHMRYMDWMRMAPSSLVGAGYLCHTCSARLPLVCLSSQHCPLQDKATRKEWEEQSSQTSRRSKPQDQHSCVNVSSLHTHTQPHNRHAAHTVNAPEQILAVFTLALLPTLFAVGAHLNGLLHVQEGPLNVLEHAAPLVPLLGPLGMPLLEARDAA